MSGPGAETVDAVAVASLRLLREQTAHRVCCTELCLTPVPAEFDMTGTCSVGLCTCCIVAAGAWFAPAQLKLHGCGCCKRRWDQRTAAADFAAEPQGFVAACCSALLLLLHLKVAAGSCCYETVALLQTRQQS
jgi:hypothetical protein